MARNRGAKLVNTPYVLFLDADMYLKDKIIVKTCLEEAKRGDYDLVTCKFATLEGKFNWVYRLFDIIQLLSSKTKPFAIGGFMIFKTETFNKLGGFNEEDKVAEDYHLSSKTAPKKQQIGEREPGDACPRQVQKTNSAGLAKASNEPAEASNSGRSDACPPARRYRTALPVLAPGLSDTIATSRPPSLS